MNMRSTGIEILICLLFTASILGCGIHKAESPESAKTERSESGSSSEVAPEMVQEYAMIHQISDLKTAEFYLTHPDYAKENPYRPTSEDLAFFEKNFFQRVYPNFNKIADKRGFVHTRGAYRGFNPHDSSVKRSWKRKYAVDQSFKKTEKIDNELAVATRLYKEGRFDEAVKHMESAVQADPESPTLLYNLGLMHMKTGNYPEAMQNLEMSISQLKGTSYTNVNIAIHPEVYLGASTNLGLVYINLGAYEEAVKVLKEAIEFRPEDLDANWNLGVAYWYMGDTEQTTTQMRKYMGLDQKSAEAHNIIGLIYYSKELHNAALDEFQKAAELKPDEKQYSYNEGLTLARLGRYDECSKAFARASGLVGAEYLRRIFSEQLAANKVRKLYNDGCTAMAEFDSTRAIELFKSALELKPDMVEAHINLGNLYGARGERRNQIRHLKEAARLQPDAVKARYSLGLAYFDARMYSEAMVELEKASQLDPSLSGAHFKVGMVLCKAQNYGDAAEKFEKSLKLSPDWFEAHINLGTCYLRTGKVDGAIEQFGKAVELRPDSAEAHYNLGEAYIRAEAFDKASSLLQKALEIDPGHKQAQIRLKELEAYQNEHAALYSSGAQ